MATGSNLNLPKWRCHKIVQAAQIVHVSDDAVGLEWDVGAMVRVPVVASTMYARYRPVLGDYYVVYEDGYASISPKKAFEEGYSPLAHPEAQAPSPSIVDGKPLGGPQQAYADRLSKPHG